MSQLNFQNFCRKAVYYSVEKKQESGDGTNHRQSLRLHFRRKFTEPNVMRKEHLRQKFPVKKQVVLMC